jgi:O-methyltransferase involved in polyketide biosynthesis
VAFDLSDRAARRDLFLRITEGRKRALVISEGLVLYLSPQDVGALAQDLADTPVVNRWTFDLVSPGLLRMAQERLQSQLDGSGASLKFAPADGPSFFERYGWTPVEVRSLLKTAARLKRLPLSLRLMALLPESKRRQGSRPWSAICLMKKISARDA